MKYELKKFIFNRRNIGVFGFLFAFIICFICYNVYMNLHYNESQIEIYQKAYRTSENRIDESSTEEESIFWKGLHRNAYNLIQLYSNNENKTDVFIESKVGWNNLIDQAYQNGYVVTEFEKRDSQTIQNETKQLKYLKKNHIELLNSPYEPNTINILYSLFNQKLYLIIMLVLCILFCDVFGLEMENGFYKNLYVSKISKKKILLNKIKFSLALSISLIVVTFSIIILSGFIFGFGNSEYPYFYLKQVYIVKDIVVKSMILLAIECIFVTGISSLWFSFSLNNGFVLAVNLILYALFFVVGNVVGDSNIFVYIPFLHIDFMSLITHNHVILAAFVNLLYFVFCVFASLQVFRKRELVR